MVLDFKLKHGIQSLTNLMELMQKQYAKNESNYKRTFL